MNDVVLGLAIALLAAEVGGAVAHAARLPRVVGQIGAGLVIGPSLLGVVRDGDVLQILASLGALAILAVAGLETDVAALRAVGRGAALAAGGGVALPFFLGLIVAVAAGLPAGAALFCGAVLTATSVGITAAALQELGLLHGRAGLTILGAAVIDDVLGLLVLAFVAGSGRGAGSLSALGPALGVIAASLLALRLAAGHLDRLLQRLHTRGGGPAAALALVLLAGWLYQTVGGLAAITGAYVAGLALAGSSLSERIKASWVAVGETLCSPLFFVAVGLAADLRQIGPWLPFGLALLLVAVAGKVIGCGVGAWAGGLTPTEAGVVGIGMVARGEVALVAAALGLQAGAIGVDLYGALVLVALATTILAPLGMQLWVRFRGERLTERVAGALPLSLGRSLRPDAE